MRRTANRALVMGVVVTTLVASVVVPAGPAAAAGRPGGPVGPPVMFPATAPLATAHALGGNVNAQAQIGSTIYVGGTFLQVDDAGTTVDQPYLFAMDAPTGRLVTTFAPSLDGQVMSLLAGNDRMLYVSGMFSTAGGCDRCDRLARLDPSTGAADPTLHAPPNSGAVRLRQHGTTLFLGGWFTRLGGVPMGYFGAVDMVSGTVDLRYANVAADGKVRGMALSADGSRLYLAGLFSTIGGQVRTRFASIDTTTVTLTEWRPEQVRADGWDVTLSPDGQTAYLATANGVDSPCAGHYEAVVAVPSQFAGVTPILWAQGPIPGCVWNSGDVNVLVATDVAVFAGGHQALLEDGSVKRRHLSALDVGTGRVLDWNPTVDGRRGVVTMELLPAGLFVGGDFDRVGRVDHRRLALLPIVPDLTPPSRPAAPAAISPAIGRIDLQWPSSTDDTSPTLTYFVYRDGGTTPIASLEAAVPLHPTVLFSDVGLEPGSTHTYEVVAADRVKASRRSDRSPPTVARSTAPIYREEVALSGPSCWWRLGEASGPVAADSSGGGRSGRYEGGVTLGTPAGLAADADTAATLDGATGYVTSEAPVSDPRRFSLEVRFATTSPGGRLLGFGGSRTGLSPNYDRHLYMTDDGRIVFGVHPGRVVTIASPGRLDDGLWHHVAASLGPDGMALYVDGERVARNTEVAEAQHYDGYWRAGYDDLAGWTERPTRLPFAGSIDEVAVYDDVLAPEAVALHAAAQG